MEFSSAAGEQKYAALVRAAGRSVIGLDFDGTLAPIVDDPGAAHIHPEAGEVLIDLAEHVAAIAVITGRPARQALALGGLDEVGAAIGDAGKELHIFGQYGNEHWSSTNRRIVSPRPPTGLTVFLRDLPKVLREADAAEAHVEDKGLAYGIHTRRLPDADAAYERLLAPLRDLASRTGLVVEPGRQVIEVRAPGMDKGQAVARIADEVGAQGFLFAGDDLGDVEAFEAVEVLGKDGAATLLVCSASTEESALVPLSDVVVHGPDGVLALLRQFCRDVDALEARPV